MLKYLYQLTDDPAPDLTDIVPTSEPASGDLKKVTWQNVKTLIGGGLGLRVGTTGVLSGVLQDVKDANAVNSGLKLSTTNAEYTGIFAFASKTASTLIYLNASKEVTSLANSAGVLTNDGSGGLSWGAVSLELNSTLISGPGGGESRILYKGSGTLLGSSDFQYLGGKIVIESPAPGFNIGTDPSNYVTAISNSAGGMTFTSVSDNGDPLFTFNKSISARIRPRTLVQNAPSATPSINTDIVDFQAFTGISNALTSMTTNLTGTPTEAQKLWLAFTDNGTARAITWGASFESGSATLPTTTVISTRLDVGFIWNTVTSKWRCVAAG